MINDPKDLDQERIMYFKLKQSYTLDGDRSDSTTYMTVASSTSISQP